MANVLRTGLARLGALPWPRAWRAAPRRLRIAETLSLGNRGFIAIVECGTEQLLIGGTSNSMALLTKLPHARERNSANLHLSSEEGNGL